MSIILCKHCKRNIETLNCNKCVEKLAKKGIVWIKHNSYLTGHAAKNYSGPLFDTEEHQRKQALKNVGTNNHTCGCCGPDENCPRCKDEGILKNAEEIIDIPDSSENNGGDTDYYRINPKWFMAQDIIEARSMNYSQGNVFKAAFCFNQGRHGASDYERELNKIVYFAKRELERIKHES